MNAKNVRVGLRLHQYTVERFRNSKEPTLQFRSIHDFGLSSNTQRLARDREMQCHREVLLASLPLPPLFFSLTRGLKLR